MNRDEYKALLTFKLISESMSDINWITVDENGEVWGFDLEPKKNEHDGSDITDTFGGFWAVGGVGPDIEYVSYDFQFKINNIDWEDSLISLKELFDD